MAGNAHWLLTMTTGKDNRLVLATIGNDLRAMTIGYDRLYRLGMCCYVYGVLSSSNVEST